MEVIAKLNSPFVHLTVNNRLETAQVKMSEFEDHNKNYPIRSIERKNTGKKFHRASVNYGSISRALA